MRILALNTFLQLFFCLPSLLLCYLFFYFSMIKGDNFCSWFCSQNDLFWHFFLVDSNSWKSSPSVFTMMTMWKLLSAELSRDLLWLYFPFVFFLVFLLTFWIVGLPVFLSICLPCFPCKPVSLIPGPRPRLGRGAMPRDRPAVCLLSWM